MTIEKINDNQIRATLTRSDLENREIRLSELFMGSDKARELFQDLMHQAYIEHGFEADENYPLMIEAIPVSMECLILVITRVDDPDELDTRLSRFRKITSNDPDRSSEDLSEEDFSEEDQAEDGDSDSREEDIFSQLMQHFEETMRKKYKKNDKHTPSYGESDPTASAPDTGSGIRSGSNTGSPHRLTGKKNSDAGKTDSPSSASTPAPAPVRIFSFSSMNTVSSCCALIEPFYKGKSCLFRNPAESEYLLVLHRLKEDDGSYDRSCRLICDFASPVQCPDALESYFREHYRTVLDEDAVSILSTLA